MEPRDIIAILALILSIVSLLWQAWTWRSSGPRVKVQIVPGYERVFAWGEPTKAQQKFNQEQARWRDHYYIVVSNTGRAPTTVEKIEMGTQRTPRVDVAGHIVSERSSQAPPHRLEPASTARWLIPLDSVTTDIRAKVELVYGDEDDYLFEHRFSKGALQSWITLGNGEEILSEALSGEEHIMRFWTRLSLALLMLRAGGRS